MIVNIESFKLELLIEFYAFGCAFNEQIVFGAT
jgi:hypothetical protein